MDNDLKIDIISAWPIMPEIALYHPEIHSNTGAILRTAACFGVQVHIIMPTGFAITDASFRRSAMHYLDLAKYSVWDSFSAFQEHIIATNKKLIVTSAQAKISYTSWQANSNDVILFGPESTGVPQEWLSIYDAIAIPMKTNSCSLNLSASVAIIVSEMLRQLTKHRLYSR